MKIFSWKEYRKRKEWHYKKQALHQLRRFQAATVSRLSSAFGISPIPIDSDLRRGLKILIGRSRDLAQNSDYVRRYLKMVKDNVVGSAGIKLIAETQRRDRNGLDDAANTAIESAWKEYQRYGVPEVTGKLSGIDCQRLFIESVIRDGEVLIQKHPNWRGNDFGYAIEFLDPLLMDPEHNETFNGNKVILGVEVNDRHRPLAYWIQGESESVETHRIGDRVFSRIPAAQIMHRYLPEFVFQTRGFPGAVSAMTRLKMLDGYEEAALIAARVGAATMGFFFPNDQDETYAGDDTDSLGVPIMDAEPGKFVQMPRNGSFETYKPNQPTAEYAQFLKGTLRGIASGLGVSYNALANDLEGVNFSSIRTGVLEDREAWMGLQRWMIDCFMWEWFMDWLRPALLNQQISMTRPSDGTQVPLKASELERFKRVRWQPRRWKWVDPEKDLKAAKIAIDERLTSRSKVMREQGDDPSEIFEEIQAEQAQMDEKQIEVIKGTSNAQGTTETEESETGSEG